MALAYRREIDGLRAIAVLPVILFHAGFQGFSGGFVGVDVFFVISGYLITSILASDLAGNTFSLRTFYERRARRILPALVFVIVTCIPFAWAWLSPSELKNFAQSIGAVALFASNILFWRESGYFEPSADLKPLLHTWSLAVEEQFYLFYPLVLLVLWRAGARFTKGNLILLATASFALAQWGARHHPEASFFLLPSRGWELLIGALLALPAAGGNNGTGADSHRRNPSDLLASTGLGLVLLPVILYNSETPFPSFYALAPTIGTALLIQFATPTTLVGRILCSAPLVRIGLVSYSAYLWHQPLFAFYRLRFSVSPSEPVLLLLCAASLCLAYLSWRFVEAPFRDRRLFSRPRIFMLAGAASATMLAVAMAGQYTDGFLNAKVSDAHRAVLKTVTSSSRRNECHTRGAPYRDPDAACEYNGGTTEWAVLGDSHAVELAFALAERLTEVGRGLKHFSHSNCAPGYSEWVKQSMTDCAEWTKETVQYLLRHRGIANVVVSYRLHLYLFGEHETSYPKLPSHVRSDVRDARWRSLVEILRALEENGKRVTLVLQAPELPRHVETLLTRSANPLADVKGVPADWWRARSEYVSSRLAELPRAVTVLDPASVLCSEESCLAARGGTAYYFDDDHLSVAGARLVASALRIP